MSMPQRPRHLRLGLLSLAICSALPGLAVAQSASKGQVQTADELNPLVVTATRNKRLTGKTPQKITIITREEIEQQLAITNDPGQVLSNLIPSYSPSRQKLNNTGETLRGRSALFMVDGVPQTNALRDGGRDSYTIDLSMVERIEVIHGASAEHGLGATGGIINYVTKRADAGTVNQHAGISLTSDDDVESEGFGHKLDYRISGQSGDWDYLAAASRQDRGVFFDGNDEEVGIAYHGEIQNSESYDLFGKLGYWIDENQNLELSLNHFDLDVNDDYVPVAGDRSEGIATSARKGSLQGEPGYNEVTKAQLAYSHGDWFGNELDAQLYTQRFRAQFGATGLGSFPYQDENGETRFDQTRNESDKVGGKFTLSRDGLLDDRLKLTTGVDLLQDETQQVLVQTGRNYVPETQFRNVAAFLQGDVDLTDSLSLHAGARQEHAELNVDDYSTVDRGTSVENDLVSVKGGNPDFDETLFNAGLVYQATDWAQLYANYSEGFGMPDVGRVLRGVATPGQDVDTLVDLSPIVTDNREIGARFDWERYSLELSYYESDSDLGQRIQPDAQGNYRVQREKTEIQGYEITGEARPNDVHRLRLTYAHAEGESDQDGDGEVDTKLTGRDIAPDTLKLSWSAAWTDKLSSHLQYSYYRDRSFDDPALEFDGYGLVDASLAYRLPVGRASLGLENLTDEDYFTYYSQSFPQSSALEDDLYFKGRGRTLTLGYQVDF
ncbi:MULTISPECIES: TonB-dependent receptor [Halomonas]|uniref:TonB-dependent receptor n=1 Tax=Halomonas TaxID=2745 RepID=UPI0004863144|nr:MULTISPECIES: TonB-dependent receptor [Halomonas]